jgi:uncharacterized protein YndB with AHSA1/START domain
MPDCLRVSLQDSIAVALPPDEAFRLFTPRGEEAWAVDWRPRCHAPAADDSLPGTSFEIARHDHVSTWVVVHREPGRLIEYAWLAPGERAAALSVALAPSGDGGTRATVTYHMTSLVPEANPAVQTFATSYREFLDYWQSAIADALG